MSLTVWIFSGKKKLSGEFCGETELGKQIEPLMYPLTSIHGEPHGKPPSLYPPLCSCSQKPSWTVIRSPSWFNPWSRSHKHTTLGKRPVEADMDMFWGLLWSWIYSFFVNKNVFCILQQDQHRQQLQWVTIKFTNLIQFVLINASEQTMHEKQLIIFSFFALNYKLNSVKIKPPQVKSLRFVDNTFN